MASPIFISSDHAGVKLKTFLLKHLTQYSITDLGPYNQDSVDYPDFADLVCKKIQESHLDSSVFSKGILICGSGQGMIMRANKYPFIRAGLCHTPYSAQLTREHNDANVLCLASRPTSQKESTDFIYNPSEVNNIRFNNALKTVESFLNTSFEGGRHQVRTKKLSSKVRQ